MIVPTYEAGKIERFSKVSIDSVGYRDENGVLFLINIWI